MTEITSRVAVESRKTPPLNKNNQLSLTFWPRTTMTSIVLVITLHHHDQLMVACTVYMNIVKTPQSTLDTDPWLGPFDCYSTTWDWQLTSILVWYRRHCVAQIRNWKFNCFVSKVCTISARFDLLHVWFLWIKSSRLHMFSATVLPTILQTMQIQTIWQQLLQLLCGKVSTKSSLKYQQNNTAIWVVDWSIDWSIDRLNGKMTD